MGRVENSKNSANNDNIEELIKRMEKSSKRMQKLRESDELRESDVNLDEAIQSFEQKSNRKYTAPKGTKNKMKKLSEKAREFIHENATRIKAAVLVAIAIAGVATGVNQAIKSNKETNQIVAEYNGDTEAIKDSIRDKIAEEFKRTYDTENLDIEIEKYSSGSKEVGNIITVVDENEKNIATFKNVHDLGGGIDHGNNKSGKLSDIADAYNSIDRAKDPAKAAAKVLKKTNAFVEKYDLKVTIGGEKEKVDHIKANKKTKNAEKYEGEER